MNPRIEGQQEIYQALVVASDKVTKAMVETFKQWQEIHAAFEGKIKLVYKQNADLKMQAKAEMGKELVTPTPTNVDTESARVANALNKQNEKLAKRNSAIQDISTKLSFLGNANLPKETALKIQASQEKIISMSLKVNQVAQEAQKLFQAQAMLAGTSKNVTPEQKHHLDNKIKEYTELNKQLKDLIKQQAQVVSQTKNEVEEQQTTRRARL